MDNVIDLPYFFTNFLYIFMKKVEISLKLLYILQQKFENKNRNFKVNKLKPFTIYLTSFNKKFNNNEYLQ
jgi:hypothetical protein